MLNKTENLGKPPAKIDYPHFLTHRYLQITLFVIGVFAVCFGAVYLSNSVQSVTIAVGALSLALFILSIAYGLKLRYTPKANEETFQAKSDDLKNSVPPPQKEVQKTIAAPPKDPPLLPPNPNLQVRVQGRTPTQEQLSLKPHGGSQEEATYNHHPDFVHGRNLPSGDGYVFWERPLLTNGDFPKCYHFRVKMRSAAEVQLLQSRTKSLIYNYDNRTPFLLWSDSLEDPTVITFCSEKSNSQYSDLEEIVKILNTEFHIRHCPAPPLPVKPGILQFQLVIKK